MIQRLVLLALVIAVCACDRPERLDPGSGQMLRIDPARPPTGAQLVQILLENQSLPLKGTGCSSDPDDKASLQELLARTFGAGIDDPGLRTTHAAGCEAAQFERRGGAVVNVWLCHVYLRQWQMDASIKDDRLEPVTQASISFGVTKDTWSLVVDSVTPPSPLVCTP